VEDELGFRLTPFSADGARSRLRWSSQTRRREREDERPDQEKREGTRDVRRIKGAG
jgi:hypothetical protein